MKKNIIYNKYYKHLRSNIFQNLEIAEFMEVWSKFVRLKFQYKLLCICNFLEKINIPVIQIPLLRFCSKLFDFTRWKIYDFIMLLINGKMFNLYGVTCYCGRQRKW